MQHTRTVHVSITVGMVTYPQKNTRITAISWLRRYRPNFRHYITVHWEDRRKLEETRAAWRRLKETGKTGGDWKILKKTDKKSRRLWQTGEEWRRLEGTREDWGSLRRTGGDWSSLEKTGGHWKKTGEKFEKTGSAWRILEKTLAALRRLEMIKKIQEKTVGDW